MTPGRSIEASPNPKAALVHATAEDLDEAGQGLTTAAPDRATQESTTMNRDFYLVERLEPRDRGDSSGAMLTGCPDESGQLPGIRLLPRW